MRRTKREGWTAPNVLTLPLHLRPLIFSITAECRRRERKKRFESKGRRAVHHHLECAIVRRGEPDDRSRRHRLLVFGCKQLSLRTMKGRSGALIAVALLLLSPLSTPKILRPQLHGRAIPVRDLDTRHGNTKKKIVLMHNFYRAKVEPPAGDMLQMTWHKGAEEAAQAWADACQFLVHDKPLSRWVEDFGSCGQNIFVSSAQVDWMFVIKAWYMEHRNFTYGSRKNDWKSVGHYTQMVWYNSHKIGCGFNYCGKDVTRKPFYNYVCNYCPIGNDPRRLSRPYSVGKPCDKCKEHCKFKKLCTNSCPYGDFWLNCVDLNTTFHSWLCGEGAAGRRTCAATCSCPNTIR